MQVTSASGPLPLDYSSIFLPPCLNGVCAWQVVARCRTNTFSKYLDPEVTRRGEAAVVGTKLRALYPMTSMISHSCSPNVEQTIGDHK